MQFDKNVSLKFYQLFLIASTRVALGAGVGLLLADRLSDRQRIKLGRTLALVGLLSTIPLATEVLAKAGAFRKQSEDTSGLREEGRQRNQQEQASATW
jgi:hypothetical protein